MYFDIYSKDAFDFEKSCYKKTFKNSEHINEKKGNGPYRGFGFLSLLNDPLYLATYGAKAIELM